MTDPEREELAEALNRRFDAVDARLDTMDRRFDTIDRRFDAVDRRFDAVDTKLASHDRQFDAVARELAAVHRRFDAFEAHVDARFNEVFGHFDEVYRRIERLEQEHLMIVEGLRRIEATLLDERGRRELLERRLEELKREVTGLQARIQEIDQRLQRR